MYSRRASVTASFFVRRPPTVTASSTNAGSRSRFVATHTIYHTHICVAFHQCERRTTLTLAMWAVIRGPMLQWSEQFVRDVRQGFRTFRRDRFFALSITLILALGIGTTAAMFSVLRTVVLRPLP